MAPSLVSHCFTPPDCISHTTVCINPKCPNRPSYIAEMNITLVNRIPSSASLPPSLLSLPLSPSVLHLQSVSQLLNLAVLDVTKNKLERLPEQTSRLKCLSDLHASENCIEVLPNDIGQLWHLEQFLFPPCGDVKRQCFKGKSSVRSTVCIYWLMYRCKCTMRNIAQGRGREADIAQGKAECCIYLRIMPVCSIFP